MSMYKPIEDTAQALAALRSVLAMAVGKGAITRAGYDHGHEAVSFLESPAPADGWQPIETAPGDSENFILVSDGISVAPVKTINGTMYCLSSPNLGWQGFTRLFATHWRPLPAPPEGEACAACKGNGKAGEVA